MDDKARTTQAATLLNSLLQWQPHLFESVKPTEANGEGIAVFCDSFIRKYSELLRTRDGGQSRP